MVPREEPGRGRASWHGDELKEAGAAASAAAGKSWLEGKQQRSVKWLDTERNSVEEGPSQHRGMADKVRRILRQTSRSRSPMRSEDRFVKGFGYTSSDASAGSGAGSPGAMGADGARRSLGALSSPVLQSSMQLHYPTASLGVWGSSGLSPSSGARAALHSIGGSRPHVAAPAVEKASCEPCAGTAAGHGAHPQGTSEEGVPAKHSEGASAQADRPWWSQSAPMSPLANGRGSSGSWQLADGGRRQLSLSPSILPADGSLAVPHISPAGTSHVQQAPLPAGASHTQQSPALAPSLPPHLRVAFRAAPLGARAGPAQAEAPPHSGPPASSPTLLAQSHPSEGRRALVSGAFSRSLPNLPVKAAPAAAAPQAQQEARGPEPSGVGKAEILARHSNSLADYLHSSLVSSLSLDATPVSAASRPPAGDAALVPRSLIGGLADF